MTQVNLLPWREEAKQFRKTRFTVIIIGTVILAFIAIFFVHIIYSGLINVQLERNNYLSMELSKAQDQLNVLNAKKKELLALDDALHFVMSLREESYRSIELLDALARITPEAIAFNKIERKGSHITISGKAKSDSQISLLMDSISKTKIFKQPNLTLIAGKESPTGEERLFQIDVDFQDYNK